MALQLTHPPQQLTDSVRSALQHKARKRRFVTPALAGSKAASLSLVAPHPVFALSLEDLTSGRGLDAAVQVGWRYLVSRDDRTLAAVETPMTEVEPELQLNEGPFVGGTVETIRLVEDLDEVKQRDFELRLLKVVALYTVALWLQGDDDILVPMAQCHPALESGGRYSGVEFVERLREPAQQQAAFDTSPRER